MEVGEVLCKRASEGRGGKVRVGRVLEGRESREGEI